MNKTVTLLGGECPRTFKLSGRIGQTMHNLMQAKSAGITSLESPALRLASHIHVLRKMGFSIETELEPHGGTYSGNHARYRLLSEVVPADTAKGPEA
ncbi:hypothetical protein IV417_16120 [Alphaproteobacteria bacterium KMM 3653]|uniref:Winged helix domain-containing protein n=1 Tax=Harenicola maris TaxID=2841044 RepID=A0AAP2G520_9RHOB|nr:hypothetical protein [Harenicola maris]